MSEKPPKRLVSRIQYGRVLRTRTRLLAAGSFFAFVSFMAFSIALWPVGDSPADDVRYSGGWWFNLIFRLAVALWAARVTYGCFKEERKVQRVKLVTKRTSHLLPAVETLVRASDLPPSNQQAELLRGVAPPTSETPPEELLRATRSSAPE